MTHPFLHASAPAGMKCADCRMNGEPCPICYTAGWKVEHPHDRHIHQNGPEAPLRACIDGEAIVIRIGIDILAHAAENIQELWDHEEKLKVCHKVAFARDVVRMLEHEDEIGASLLTKLFDEAAIDAWEDGSVGCHEGKVE
jgi:hypothetical protein